MKRALTVLIVVAVCVASPGSGFAKTTKAKGHAKHTVRRGETLLGIAHASGVKLADLKALNGLKGSRIHPGQLLLLPEPQTPRAAKSGANSRVSKAAPEPPANYLPLDALPAAGGGDLSEIALTFLSTPYRFGAEGRDATDCSGFTQQVFRLLGLDLPRTARAQYRNGAVVPPGEWQFGDLLFFRTYARYPSHVAIYLGDGKMIHASRSQRKVVISEADRPYFRKRFLGARRIACFDPVVSIVDRLSAPSSASDDGDLFEADLSPSAGEGDGAEAPSPAEPETFEAAQMQAALPVPGAAEVR